MDRKSFDFLKRKSEENITHIPEPKRLYLGDEFSEEQARETNYLFTDEQQDENDERNLEFNEEEEEEYIDEDDEEEEDEEEENEKRNGAITIADDNYLSFSDNEISDERIQESRQNPDSPKINLNKTQRKLKKKRKKKNPNLRKNIRNVLKDKQLDSMTQMLREKEMDRLKRLGLLKGTVIVSSTSSSSSSAPKKITVIKSTPKLNKVKTNKDVICLSSSDEDNTEHKKSPGKQPAPTRANKEVLVLSSDSCDDFGDDDNLAEHHSDLGLHTKDAFNIPEANGKVWVNLNNKEADKKIYLSHYISKILKPHQIGGLRFMFDNLIESVKDFQPNLGNGCILAHAMGLGKTIQTITFIDLFLRCTPAKKVLCVVPVNTIQNWSNEFNKWIPPKPKVPLITKVNRTENIKNTVRFLGASDGISSMKSESLQSNICHSDVLSMNRDEIEQNRDRLGTELFEQESNFNMTTFGESRPDCQTIQKKLDVGDVERNVKQENDFPDFKVVRELLINMVDFIDENSGMDQTIKDFDMDISSDENDDRYRDFDVLLIDAQKSWPDRIGIIDEWAEKGGVLLIGYEMYRMVASGLKTTKFKGRKGKILEERRNLKQAMKEAICDPGPDLVVCDEGHRIRNYQSGISQSLKSICTRKRLVLTGYPLQNNLMEYWCMVDFVRPDYLGSRQEFANMFERPILNGQCVDSTPGDKRLMRERAHVLYSLLQGFVQRRGHKVFKAILPEKQEHVIMVRMSPIQKALYQKLVELTREAYSDSLNPIKTFHLCCKIWNHPDILYKAIQSAQQGREVDIISDEDDIDNDSISNMKQKRKRVSKLTSTSSPPSHSATETYMQDVGFSPFLAEPREILMDITQWAPEIFRNHSYVPGDHNNSGKFKILQDLIKESMTDGDKMLIFSQSLLTLNTIEDMLHKTPVTEGDPDIGWRKEEDYFRLDGSTSSNERERIIDLFNKKGNTKAKLFLLSTRAGCLGINLVAANRVVVFDVSWNPCHDAQAVCRIYRYGQTKPCYIYRLVASNTMEKKIYYRQISKQGISNRVIDEMNQTENFSRNEIQSLIAEDQIDEPHPDLGAFVTTHRDRILNSIVLNRCDWITKVPFKHESLLINEEETEKLTGSEKRAAKRAYEAQKQMSRTGFRSYPLQQNFPSNTPVAPVRPFLWRPPPSSNANTNISISFPVMVGNSVTNIQNRTVSLPSIARTGSLSSSSSTNNPFLTNLLSTLRQSLSSSDLIANTTASDSNYVAVSSSANTLQNAPLMDGLALANAANRRKEIEQLLLHASRENPSSNNLNHLTTTEQIVNDMSILQGMGNTCTLSMPTQTTSQHPFNSSQSQSRPTSSASNDVIVLDDSDEG